MFNPAQTHGTATCGTSIHEWHGFHYAVHLLGLWLGTLSKLVVSSCERYLSQKLQQVLQSSVWEELLGVQAGWWCLTLCSPCGRQVVSKVKSQHAISKSLIYHALFIWFLYCCSMCSIIYQQELHSNISHYPWSTCSPSWKLCCENTPASWTCSQMLILKDFHRTALR